MGDARRAITEDSARRLVRALDTFRLAHRRLPKMEEGLAALVPESFETVPLDAWGNPFVYVPSADGRWADVVSLGADGEPGGRGESSDISGRFGSANLALPAWVNVVGNVLFPSLLVIGGFAARRSAFVAGMLAGTATMFGVLLLAAVAAPLDFSVTGIAALLATLGCFSGSIAIFRRTPGSRLLAPTAALCAYTLLSTLINE